MRRDLMRLKADCEDLMRISRAETTELLGQVRITPAAIPPIDNVPPTSVDQTPATEQEQKRWRFTTGENGQIPPALALKAATNQDLLLAIQEEIEQRIAEEKA